jgi:two-component system response regulator CiaR
MKILIVEDYKELASHISDYLKKEDYICEVVSTKEEADEKIDFLNMTVFSRT